MKKVFVSYDHSEDVHYKYLLDQGVFLLESPSKSGIFVV